MKRARGGARPGESGEARASRYLVAQGFSILDRNFACRLGEVDVIAREGDVTVFVEVKERRGDSHGEGYDAVGFGKRRRVVRAARLYASSRGLSDTAIRFDVISIDWDGRREPKIRHDRGAFDADAQ